MIEMDDTAECFFFFFDFLPVNILWKQKHLRHFTCALCSRDCTTVVFNVLYINEMVQSVACVCVCVLNWRDGQVI